MCLKFLWSCEFVQFSFQCGQILPFSFRFALYISIQNCFIFLAKWIFCPHKTSLLHLYYRFFALKGISDINIVITVYCVSVFSWCLLYPFDFRICVLIQKQFFYKQYIFLFYFLYLIGQLLISNLNAQLHLMSLLVYLCLHPKYLFFSTSYIPFFSHIFIFYLIFNYILPPLCITSLLPQTL